MSDHTRLHHFGTTASDPDVRHFTEPSHVPVHLYRHHELSIKIQTKEWITALVLKHLLVSWDLWTYCIGFKLQHRHRHHHRHIFASMRRDDTMCWYRDEMRLSRTYVRTYDSSNNNNNHLL